jgi:hypothetical protein
VKAKLITITLASIASLTLIWAANAPPDSKPIAPSIERLDTQNDGNAIQAQAQTQTETAQPDHDATK